MFDPLEIKSTALEEAVWQMPAAVVIAEAPSGRILLTNKRARETMQRNLGRSFPSELEEFRRIRKGGGFRLFHLDGRTYEPDDWPLTRTSRTGEEIRDEEYFFILGDGTRTTMRCDCCPVYDSEGRVVAAVGVYHDITRQKRSEEEIKTRTREQAVVARLGLQALATDDAQSLMDEAVALIAQTLQVEYSEVVEVLPGGKELLLRAGEGWEEGLVGTATVRAGSESQAGYALLVNEPVIVEDLSTETRFSPPPVLHEHEIVSGMSVVIRGQTEPLGLLGVYTTSRRTFSEDDVNFMQAVANVLATAVERRQSEEKLRGVREDERSRIARDLHDEALANLSYALAEARTVQSTLEGGPQTVQRLERLVTTLKGVGQQLRGAIYDLRLEKEQERPFSELLGSLVELYQAMDPDCDISLNLGDGILSGVLGETGRELLRIVREALTNARRHSGAHNVRVVARVTGNRLHAEVSDDGRGFDPAKMPSDLRKTGIRGMRERARALGGELKIRSEPGHGTTVRFEMVLKSLQEERDESEGRVRVLLVEDHAAVREAIASAFEGEAGFEVVGQAASLDEARAVLGAEEIDVAVVDLGLPDGYGADLIPELREANPQAQALILSASLDRVEIAGAVESGAAAVLHKTVHLDEVVDAVRRLRAGETLMPLEEVVELMRYAGSERERELEIRRSAANLTPRELEVLQALAEGLDSEDIAGRLSISVRTQRNHVASILAKLGVHSQLQALVFALRHGLVEIR